MNVVSFMSDFGLEDHYVGVVKGIMLRINPDVRIIDLSHGLKPFATRQAAYLLGSSYRFFPKDTVHLTVVDPGVGTDRTPLILRTASYFFVGPDNGIFTDLLKYEGVKIYQIQRDAVNALGGINSGLDTTFDGRDLFGPVAALISRGINIEDLAKPMGMRPVLLEEPVCTAKGWQSVKVLHIDHFGNIITALHRNHLKNNLMLGKVKAGARLIQQISKSYGDAPVGSLLAIWGSSGYLEISINQGSAAKLLNCIPESDIIKVNIQ